MNTPSHAILNLALLGRQKRPEWNLWIVLGGILPDAAMFLFYGWAKGFTDLTEAQIWGSAYYDPGWQTLFDLWNSIPLALLGMGIALGYRRRAIAMGFASVIFHCLQDLPTHREDAHRHFWPLSQFRFASPISYWDPAHHGDVFVVFELIAVLLASVYVFRWIRSGWGKACLIVSNVFMLLAYIAFYGMGS